MQLANWIEIPVADIDRAAKFYEKLLGVQLTDFVAGKTKMKLFPEDEHISGALVYNPEYYFPGEQGPLVYLNMGDSMQKALDFIENSGGELLIDKRQISEEFGYMAVIKDSEGNRLALHSGK